MSDEWRRKGGDNIREAFLAASDTLLRLEVVAIWVTEVYMNLSPRSGRCGGISL